MKIYLFILFTSIPMLSLADAPPQKLTPIQRMHIKKQRKQQKRIKRLTNFLNSKRGKRLMKRVMKKQAGLEEQPHKWDLLFGVLILSPIVTYYALASTGLPFINILGIALLAGLVVYGLILLFGLLLPYLGTQK
ncbi:hypothetical protein BKI52_22070 [marine bacterium AO1-C]|nr:hypothetical protein BKI52_22070 [marine bacterium AO1-C]